MVVIDTNIVSELMRAEPSAEVLSWMDNRPSRELFVTAVTEAEIRTGIAVLPEGKRRRGLARGCERAFDSLFAGRVLPFDRDAARANAEIVAARRAIGRPVAQVDGQIAAIARSRGMAVATRTIRDPGQLGTAVFYPWDRA